jgi:hypothetical protein
MRSAMWFQPVLLPPESEAAASHYDAADQRALELARAARFAPRRA